MKNPNRGRVYRRCACRGADGRQLGARCPKLTNRKHGTWTYAADLPTLDGKRRTRRRSRFATMASKTLRHSTLSTTTEIYGHLLCHVALDAVKAIETALKEAEAA